MELSELIKFCTIFNQHNYDFEKIVPYLDQIQWKSLKKLLSSLKNKNISKYPIYSGFDLHHFMVDSLISQNKLDLYLTINNFQICDDTADYNTQVNCLQQCYTNQKCFSSIKFYKSCQFGLFLNQFDLVHKKAVLYGVEQRSKLQIFKDLQISYTYAKKHTLLGKFVKNFPRLQYLDWSFDKFFRHRNELKKIFNPNNVNYKHIQFYWSQYPSYSCMCNY